jgi:polyether ionophore transport system permease protein
MSAWTGAGPLALVALRRDRLVVAVWSLVLLAVCYASAAATGSLYPTVASRVAAATAINTSPAVVALYGPIVDVRSTGELSMTKMTVLYAVFVALLFLVLVRRHTRMEEETGQAELLGGTAIGYAAPLAAAVAASSGVALVLGALAGLVDIAGGLPVAGSLAFGASWAGVGLVSIGLTAVACQLSASSRTCAAIAGGAIGALFLLRAVGDTSVGWLSWLSPFGWSTQLHAWSGTRWWVLLLYVVSAALLVALAQALRSRRDLGAGMLAPRPGPATGSPRLADALALSIRLHGPMVAAWTVATAAMSLVLGSIAPNIGSMLDSPAARDMMERLGGRGALEDTLIAAELSIVAVVVTCFAIAVVGHGGADERDGRTEQVLATATSRSRSLVATLAVALVGATWLLVVTGVAVTLGYGAAAGDLGGTFGRILPAALAQAPAVWLVTAIAAAAYTLRSRWAALGWAFLVAFLTVGQLGELLRLPRWVIDLSPYVHVPKMPVEAFTPGPSLVLTGIAAALLVGSWLRYRTRDIGG